MRIQMTIYLLIYLLISNAVTSRQDQSILFSRIAIHTLLFASYLAFTNLYLMSLEKGIGVYGGLFNITVLTQTFNIFLLLLSSVILILTSFYPRKIYIDTDIYTFFPKIKNFLSKILKFQYFFDKNLILNKAGEQYRIIEYDLIIVFILCGAIFLVSTADLISMFLSIELQSYGLYIISTLYRNSESATASGLTYFLLGGLSSCFILLGSSLLYGNSGTTQLDNIYIINSISEIGASYSNDITTSVTSIPIWEGLPTGLPDGQGEEGEKVILNNGYQPHYLHTALIIMFVGFLFKVSAAPFHFWSPDVYDGIPTIVTTYVAIIAKIAVFAFFIELIFYTEYYLGDFSWKSILILSSLFYLIVGSVLGLSQFRIKRLFAYSTISHVGFILLALSINSTESIQAYIFYILQYSISNLNAFLILITIGYSLYLYLYKDKEYKDNFVDKANSPIQLISQVKGYFYINSYLAISLAITLFSFIGIPPAIGFFAKQMVLSAALDNGFIFMALIAVITSVIGAVYYLNLIRQIFFYHNDYDKNSWLQNLNITATIKPTTTVNEAFNSVFKDDTSKPESNVVQLYNDIEKSIVLNLENIKLTSSLSSTISLITLLLILFIFMPEQWFYSAYILTFILFK